jgi:SAM-dependent methyltransferase
LHTHYNLNHEQTLDTYENDSAFEGSEVGSRTASLSSSILEYRYHHGRRYHAYRAGTYLLPNDETEQDRLDLLHHIYKLAIGGALFRSPLNPTQLHRILDFGTGTGIWAIDIADEIPGAEVIGTDLSPIQPSWVPPNLRFVIDDVEDDWTYPENAKFDFIHGRAMGGSIKSWPRLFKQCLDNLTPGGWLEIQEYEFTATSDDDSIHRAKFLNTFTSEVNKASEMFGKSMNDATLHRQRMIDVGFASVRDDIYKVWQSIYSTSNRGIGST